jgi:DNA-binding CsgD family transcriptional regulator
VEASSTPTICRLPDSRRHQLRAIVDAYGDAALHGCRSDGVGALPYRAARPVPPDERIAGVPGPLSAIVMKLLAKTAEERYQTAAGVEADLRRSLAEWESHGLIELFPLGAHDALDRLLIPEKLYGREREIDTLLASFDRVVANGTLELVLVSGYSGIGKSSVVNELHKALVPPRGLFASGKFDQYKRDIPYATLAQASVAELRILFGSLTLREREVMTLVVAGLMNKQIAAKLGITEITVKVHRGHMMRKMKARSLVDLVATADLLGIRRPKH